MQTRYISMVAVVLLLVAAACCATGPRCGTPCGVDDDDGAEVEVALAQVPDNVKTAAVAAVPGLVIEEAERETEDGIVVYALEGSVGGKEYEIEVTAAGKVLEVEEDADESHDDGDDDEDDDDDD